MAFRKRFTDERGTEWFVPNRIIRDLVHSKLPMIGEGHPHWRPGLDLNSLWELAMQGKYTRQEMREFYQLIG